MSMQSPRDVREWQQAVERKLRSASNGTRIAISHANDKIDVVKGDADAFQNLTPAAPVELTVQTATYINENRKRRGNVTIDFPDVVFSTTGKAITASSYELQGQDQADLSKPFYTLATSDISSVFATDLAPNSSWKFRVRVIGSTAVKPGLWSAEVSATITADTTPPPQPSAPVATAVSGGVKLTWDGLAAGGGAMPGDFDRLEVAFGLAANPTTIVDTFYAASLMIQPKSNYNVTHYFRTRAFDTSGNASAWSVQATAIPVPLVDVDLIISHLDAATTEIVNIGNASILNGAINADKLADGAVSQIKLQDQIVSLSKLDTSANNKIQKGIDDAFTADGKAVTAQSAADAAAAKLTGFIAGGKAINLNGDFESAVTNEGWPTRSLTAIGASSTAARSGTKVLVATPTASSAYAYTDYYQSALNRVFLVEYYAKLRATAVAGSESLLMGAFFWNKRADGGAEASQAQYTDIYGNSVSLGALSTSAWTKVQILYTVNQDALSTRFAPRIPGYATLGNVIEIDDFQVFDITQAKTALDAAQAAQTSANTAITNAATAQTSANGKNKITNSTVDAGAGIPGIATGDRWQKWTSLAVGGKLLATWRWNGSTWIAEAMDPTYIPLLDIGAGTFGSLGGDRLTAKTVTTEALLVGDFTNLVDDPNMEGPGWSFIGTDPVVAGPLSVDGITVRGWKLDGDGTDVRVKNKNMFTVEPDTELYMEARVSNRTAGNAYMRIYWYDTAAVQVGTVDLVFPPIAGSNWATLNKSVTPPTGARFGRVDFLIGSGSLAGTSCYMIRPMIRRKNGGNMIIDGSVAANHVVTNSLTAKQILVGDFQNFALGSDFEDASAVPWTLHADHQITTAQKKSGTQSLRLVAGTGSRSSTFVADMRVKEGEQYYFKYHAYIDASFNGTTGNSKLRVGNQVGSIIADKTYANITRSVWTTDPLELTITVPAGCTSLTVTLVNDNTAGTAYIDDIQIRRVSEPSLIMNLGVEKLTAGTASIDTGVITKLYTEVVRSRRMTTDQMVVGRGVNGLVDEFFEQADLKTYRDTLAGGWGAWGTSGATNLNIYTAGTLTPGTSRSFFFDTVATYDKNSYIPVEPGQVWLLKAQYTSGTSGPRATLRYIKRDGTTAYQSAGWTKRDGTTNTYGAAGSIQTLERIYTVPADIAYIMPAVQFESTCTSATVYGGATFTNMATASLIVDGAITARNLTVTDEMWTNILHFKQLGGDEIDVNDLTADTAWIGVLRGGVLINDAVTTGVLKADAITSKHTITGAVVQTIVTANRGIKLTTTSMKAYNNSSGANTFTLDAATGDVTVTTLSTSVSGARVKVWDRADGTAAVDLYCDTSGVHGSLYTQPHTGNGLYVTNLMHYTANPISTTNWTSRVTLFQDETWAIGQRTKGATVTGDTNGDLHFQGTMVKNLSTAVETFVIGSTTTSSAATGTYVLTYADPVPSGTRTVLATADSASVASSATKSATASGFSWQWSTTASSNISMRFWCVWTN